MNERAFIKSCIKVAGLLLMIWGIIGLAITSIGYGAGKYQAHAARVQFEKADNDAQAKMAMTLIQAYQRTATTAMLAMPAHFVQLLAGLYLCRRYNRLLKWLLKDEPTLQ